MEDIQSWWEVPTIAHFCSLFRDAFDLLEFDIEELEDALLASTLGSCPLITELITKLLAGSYGSTAIGPGNWEDYLKDLTKYQCEVQKCGPYYLEDSSFHQLDLRKKVEILLSLCYARLEADDVLDLLKGYEGDQMRLEPVGTDKEGKVYWYFYGSRLYKEDPEPIPPPTEETEDKEHSNSTKKQQKNQKNKKGKKKSKKKPKTKTKRSSRGRILKTVSHDGESSESDESEDETKETLVNGKDDSEVGNIKDETDKKKIEAGEEKRSNEETEKVETSKEDVKEEISDDIKTSADSSIIEDTEQKEICTENNTPVDSSQRNWRWHIACTTIEDWEKLCESLKDSDFKCEKDLYKILMENFLPDMPQIIAQKEKAMKKRLSLLQPKRLSSRLQEKKEQYEEGMRLIEEEMIEEQKRKAEEEEERQRLLQLELIKEQERQREERIRLREERARRVKLREERALLVAEGKEVPPEMYESPLCNKYYKMDSGIENGDVDESLYKSFYSVIKEMKDHTDSWPFLQPVNKEIFPDYGDFVNEPMDLSLIEINCREGKYKNREDFVDDFRLMFSNCIVYNGENSDYARLANVLERYLHRLVKKHLPKEETFVDDDDEFKMKIPTVKRKHYRPRRNATAKAMELFKDAAEDDPLSDEDDYVPEKKNNRKVLSPRQLLSSKIIKIDQLNQPTETKVMSSIDILKRKQEIEELIAKKCNTSISKTTHSIFKSKDGRKPSKKMGSRFVSTSCPIVPDDILFTLVDRIEKEGFYPANGSPQQMKNKPGQMSGGSVRVMPTCDRNPNKETPVNNSCLSTSPNSEKIRPFSTLSPISSTCNVTNSTKICNNVPEINNSKVQKITVGNKVVQGRVIQLPPGTKLVPGQPIQLMQDGKKVILHTVNKSNVPAGKTISPLTTTGSVTITTGNSVNTCSLSNTVTQPTSALGIFSFTSPNISTVVSNSASSADVKTTTHLTSPIPSTIDQFNLTEPVVPACPFKPDSKSANQEILQTPLKSLSRKEPLTDKQFTPKSILIGSPKYKSPNSSSKKIVTFNDKITAVNYDRQDTSPPNVNTRTTVVKTNLSCGGALLSEKMSERDSNSTIFSNSTSKLLPCFQNLIAGNLGAKTVKRFESQENLSDKLIPGVNVTKTDTESSHVIHRPPETVRMDQTFTSIKELANNSSTEHDKSLVSDESMKEICNDSHISIQKYIETAGTGHTLTNTGEQIFGGKIENTMVSGGEMKEVCRESSNSTHKQEEIICEKQTFSSSKNDADPQSSSNSYEDDKNRGMSVSRPNILPSYDDNATKSQSVFPQLDSTCESSLKDHSEFPPCGSTCDSALKDRSDFPPENSSCDSALKNLSDFPQLDSTCDSALKDHSDFPQLDSAPPTLQLISHEVPEPPLNDEQPPDLFNELYFGEIKQSDLDNLDNIESELTLAQSLQNSLLNEDTPKSLLESSHLGKNHKRTWPKMTNMHGAASTASYCTPSVSGNIFSSVSNESVPPIIYSSETFLKNENEVENVCTRNSLSYVTSPKQKPLEEISPTSHAVDVMKSGPSTLSHTSNNNLLTGSNSLFTNSNKSKENIMSSLEVKIPTCSIVVPCEKRSPKCSPSKSLQQSDSILDKLMNEINFTQIKNKSPSPSKLTESRTSPIKSPLKSISSLNTSGLSKILSQQLHPLKKRKQDDCVLDGISPTKTAKKCEACGTCSTQSNNETYCDKCESSNMCVNGAVHPTHHKNSQDDFNRAGKTNSSCISPVGHSLPHTLPSNICNSDRTEFCENTVPQTCAFLSHDHTRPPLPRLKISLAKPNDGNRKVQFSSSIMHVVKGQSGATVIDRSASDQELDTLSQEQFREPSDVT